jgi:hypothetical protein
MPLTTSVDIVDDRPIMYVNYVAHHDADFNVMLAHSSPKYWPYCLPTFWKRVISNGDTSDGWHRIIEHIQWKSFQARVPLVWRQTVIDDSYRLEYQLDNRPIDTRRVDHWVQIDEGYIFVHRVGMGVDVTMTKALHVAGVPARFMVLGPRLLRERQLAEFFANQSRLPPGWSSFPSYGVTHNEW